MKNGMNIYFNSEELVRITSACGASRKLVEETMNKIE